MTGDDCAAVFVPGTIILMGVSAAVTGLTRLLFVPRSELSWFMWQFVAPMVGAAILCLTLWIIL